MLETAMLALQRQVLCLSEPWLARLNSELQFRTQKLFAGGKGLERGARCCGLRLGKVFGAAKRRRRALNLSYHLEDQCGAASLEVELYGAWPSTSWKVPGRLCRASMLRVAGLSGLTFPMACQT